MRKILITTTAILLGISIQAQAASITDQAEAAFRSKGFTNIEVNEQNGQVTVRAKRGNKQVETVYDRDSGEVLSNHVSGSDDRGKRGSDDRNGDHGRGKGGSDDRGGDNDRGKGGSDDRGGDHGRGDSDHGRGDSDHGRGDSDD